MNQNDKEFFLIRYNRLMDKSEDKNIYTEEEIKEFKVRADEIKWLMCALGISIKGLNA